jgi:hypothetical protein
MQEMSWRGRGGGTCYGIRKKGERRRKKEKRNSVRFRTLPFD